MFLKAQILLICSGRFLTGHVDLQMCMFPVAYNKRIDSLNQMAIAHVIAPTCTSRIRGHTQSNLQQWVDRRCQRILFGSAVAWICRQAPGCGENVWRSSPSGLRLGNILWFGSLTRRRFGLARPPRTDFVFFQRWVGCKANFFPPQCGFEDARSRGTVWR